MKPSSHEVFQFFEKISHDLAADYKRISGRSSEDPGTAGDEGEDSWAALLRDWLPNTYTVVTKGRLLAPSGEASPQIDIVVLKPNYPTFLKNRKYYLIDGVAAAFECKTTLRAGHIEKAIRTAVEIARLCERRQGSPLMEILPAVPYGLLAHSHAWHDSDRNVVDRLTTVINSYSQEVVNHPREMLEFVCIANLAGWTSAHGLNMPFLLHESQQPDRALRIAAIDSAAQAHTGFPMFRASEPAMESLIVVRPYSQYSVQYYPAHIDEAAPVDTWQNFNPVGAFVYALYKKLSYRTPELADISRYFDRVHIPAGSGGLHFGSARHWDRSVLSEAVWKTLSTEHRSRDREWKCFYF